MAAKKKAPGDYYIPEVGPGREEKVENPHITARTKEEKKAQAYFKGKDFIQALNIRFPIKMYKKLKELSYKNDIAINQIVLKAVDEYINKKTDLV